MTEKELSYNIFNFLKLNPKKITFPKIYKYDTNSFFIIQEIYKSISNINIKTYNDIFYNFKNTLLGEEWLEIFLNAKDIIEYHNNIRVNYPKINHKKLKAKISFETFTWFYNSKKKIIIENSEINLSINIEKELNKAREFLETQDWSNYFFNLQRIMHKQLIIFLNWENKSLNYSAYSKVLIKKFNELFISKETIDKYINIVQMINLYRNNFSKASAVEIALKNEFLNYSINEQKTISWGIYFNLLDLINLLINLNIK